MAPLVHSRKPRRRGAELLSGGSVQVLGESVYYEASGMGEDGPTILFLHESGGTAATWHGQLTGLAEVARCLVPDLPGHGRSEGLGHATVGDYRRAVLGFLDALAIRWPVVLAGVCLGAAVAVDLALHAPERVAGLVLFGVSEGGRACAQTRDTTARGEAPDAFVTGLFRRAPSDRLLADRLQRWRLTSPVVRHKDLTAAAWYDMLPSFQAVRHPALLVAGEEDPIATPALARQLADAKANAQATIVPGAGCLSMVEQPAYVNRAVAGFLDGLSHARPMVREAKPGGYRRR